MDLRKELHDALVCLLLINLLFAPATLVVRCEGRSLRQSKDLHLHDAHAVKHQRNPQMKALKRLDTHYASSDPFYYVGSPLSLPPYDDAMGPSSSPQDYPPFCVYPPYTPLPPSTTPSTPIPIIQPPPPTPETTNPPVLTPNPPVYIPGTPEVVPSPPGTVPNPPEAVPSPPGVLPSPPTNVSSPPEYEPSPPTYIPSPIGFVPNPPPPLGGVPNPPVYVPSPPEYAPGPPIFLPPVVYPPPITPPSPAQGSRNLWCVAKPTVPDPIIQEAMNYACGSGADCDSIQPKGSCYQPDTLIAHASFAFNSYWQRTKVAGGTCDFGGTAMLVTKDPSYDGCHFLIY
ncbi:hypothetical protein OPV22_021866 [Ensete ventricosum]|uniref:X8 domain-containing protein n=1 Tax=Ensete ventricosum TaxID=4639 RepID=A0AAV8QN20_ENSVE|nr:hypothetical protein OPV22_021866 [Ensete ventricosum]